MLGGECLGSGSTQEQGGSGVLVDLGSALCGAELPPAHSVTLGCGPLSASVSLNLAWYDLFL